VVTPAVKREAVAHLKARFGLSERRACRIAGADHKMIRYQAQRAPDAELRGRLRELANERRRFGYRRLFVLLRREGARPAARDESSARRAISQPAPIGVNKNRAPVAAG
jgi:transposase InsO family protein